MFIALNRDSVEIWPDEPNSGKFVLGEFDHKNVSDLPRLAEKMHTLGWNGSPVVLGVDSNSVLVVQCNFDRKTLRDQKALTYSLEESVPIDAESMTADILIGSNYQLAIVCNRNEIKSVLESFGNAGIPVAAICPTGLASVENLLLTGAIAKDANVVLANSDSMDFLTVKDSKVSNWTAGSISSLKRRLLQTDPSSTDPTLILGQSSVQFAELDHSQSFQLIDESPTMHAAQLALGFVQGKQELPVNFIHHFAEHDFHSKRISKATELLMASVLLLLLTFSAALYWRGNQLTSVAEQYEQQKIEVFKDVFPDQRLTPAIERSLKSKRDELLSNSGLASESDFSGLALITLHSFLASIDGELKFSLNEIKVEPKKIKLKGEIKNEPDIATFVQWFENTGFEFDPEKYGTTFIFNFFLSDEVILAKSREKANQP